MAEEYYTPKITDIRVGYNFELNEGGTSVDSSGELIANWEKCYINADSANLTEFNIVLQEGRIRTKYLTVEDVVALGWEDEGNITPPEGVISDKPVNLRRFNRGRYWMIYDFVAKVVMVALSLGDVYSVCIQRYDCPSINELTYILSSLNLKL